jgi:phosphomannomutase
MSSSTESSLYQIRFGTDGWREIIADNFTTANVRRVAYATALYLKATEANPHCVVGHDCRFGGAMFAEHTARVLAANGVKVSLAEGFVSTPMVSLITRQLKAHAGIIITASHNPPSYNGYKIKASYGGPATPDVINEIEKLIPAHAVGEPGTLAAFVESGWITRCDPENAYIDHIKASFDMNSLTSASSSLAYDAMYGAGQNVVRKLFPDTTLLHCDNNPGFMGRAPEPILKNLPELSALIGSNSTLTCGLATDGDADRIGFFDEDGHFVDSHHIILLLLKYLTEYKGYSGSVVKSFSVSDKVDLLCRKKALESITTKIGFKYICEYMVQGDVLIGAEESGGIAVKGHIPERDGIWIGLVLLEYMAKTGKTIKTLIQEVYNEVGSFAVERYDLHVAEDRKQQIIQQCRNNAYATFGNYTVSATEDLDGFKFRLGDAGWVMIRPSGTEPVLRVYAEAESSAAAFAILDATRDSILA